MKKSFYVEPTVEVVLLMSDDDVLLNDSAFGSETNPNPDSGIGDGDWENPA